MRVILCLLIFYYTQLEAKVLIITEAQIQGHVVTSREVQIHNLLNDSLGGPFENFKSDSDIEHVIKEWLLFYEASTFYSQQVAESLVSKEVSKLRKKWSGSLNKLSVQKEELAKKVRRRLEADRLYTFKKKASVLPVSMSQIETEYTQNRVRYGSLSFDEAKNQIRKNRIEANLQSRLEGWFKVLEKKYKVQRFNHSTKAEI